MEFRPVRRKHWHPDRAYIKIAFAAAVLFIFLLGCEYTALPTLIPTLAAPQNTPIISTAAMVISDVYLPDGSKVVVKQISEIAFSRLAGFNPAVIDDVISLRSGEVLVKSRLSQGVWFTVYSPHGYIARVTGSIMVVSFDPVTNDFFVDCILGYCQIGPDESRLGSLNPGERGWLDPAGNVYGPVAVDFEALRAVYGDDNLTEEPIPTATVTETPTETPTEMVTGTPSLTPGATLTPTLTPDLKATATAACKQFHRQYPATPCPK